MSVVDIPILFWIGGGILLVIAISVVVWVVMSGGRGRDDRP